jgi:hypothetical protein
VTEEGDGTSLARATRGQRAQGWLALGSLARLARFQARREEGHGWPATLVLGRWRWIRARWRGYTYYVLGVLGIVLILVPIPNPDFGPFKKTQDAEGFLRTLWQVEAAALALSLAIIVFAVQAYRSSTHERYGGTLRRYIRASWLQEGYELGVVSLLLTAAVLLGAGHGGPAGSAGAVAAGACLVSVFMLPLLLSGALRTTHRDFLRDERESRLTAAVSEQVDHEVEARHGLVLLSALAATERIELAPIGGRLRETPVIAIPAGSTGSVADINLWRLIRLGRRVRDAGGLTLRTRLYDYVGSESHLLLLPAPAPARDQRLAGRVVKLRPGRRRDETLRQYLEDLKEEAVAAIRTGGPATFDSVADAYVATLMEFPRSWRRYGHEYDAAIARGLEFFPMGPVDTISQHFYTVIVAALRGDSDEVLLSAAYLPINVCTRALEYRADGLLTKMIGLSSAFVAAGWTHGGDKGNLLAGRAPRHLVEFTRYYLQPRLEEGVIADRLRFGGYVRLVYDQFGAILKLGVDRGDVDFLRRIDGDWDTLLEHWEVDAFSSHPTVIRQLEEAVSRGEAGATERLEEAKENAKLADLSQELTDRRTILRFGLALWAWRQQPKAWRESFTLFSKQIGGLDQLARVTTKAIDAEFRDQVPWSDWILSTLQEGRAHAIGAAEGAMTTFIATALRAVSPNEQAPELPAAEWMAVYLDQARKVLADAVADARNDDLPDVAERAAKVREALEAGAEAWRQQERLSTIEAPLVPEKITKFCEQARTSLLNASVVSELLRLADAIRELDAPPDNPPLIQSQTHKALFTEDSRFVGAEMIARDVGRQLAHLELRTLIQPMAATDRRQLVADNQGTESATEFVAQLRQLVAHAEQTAKPTSVVLLLPIGWQLAEALGLSFLRGRAVPPDEWGLSEGAAHSFAGLFEGAAAYHFPQVPKDALYIVELSRYMTAEAWQPTDEKAVTVTVLSEAEARLRAEKDPGKDELGEEEIVRRWRETALVTVDPGLRLSEERDASALTAIRLAPSLRRE